MQDHGRDPVGLVRRHTGPQEFSRFFGLLDQPRTRCVIHQTLNFALDGGQTYAPQPEPRRVVNPALPYPLQFLCGDDDFLVQVNGHEYTVWSFED